jgi:phosphohistidine phosphatase
MKTLIIIRHAKAVAHDAVPTDYERALAPRGHRDAQQVAVHAAEGGLRPDLLIVSTSMRTTETAAYFIEAWKLLEEQIAREQRVYDASLHMLTSLLPALPESASCVAIVGHNPGVSELVEYLASGNIGSMPTSAVAVIDMLHAETWDEVAAGTGRVRSVFSPARIDLG